MKNWFKRLLGKKEEETNPLFKEVREGDNVNLYDQQTVDYMESNLPNPSQEAFFKLIKESDTIIISKREANRNKVVKTPITINGEITEMESHPVENNKILEITEAEEVQKIINYFEILNETKGHLMCVGNLIFEFINHQGEAIEVEYLGFGHIRLEEIFKDDAELKRPMEFLNWLNSMGVSEPLNHWIEDENIRKEEERRVSEWKSVAPKTLIKYLDTIDQNPFGGFDENLFNELRAEIPDDKELILRLFKLYGTGFYNWNGVPVYETIPENILMVIKIDFLNEIFETVNLDKEQKEGMARFLSSWDFSQQRKADLKKVSQNLKDALLAHLKEMEDEEKINQFKNRVYQ